MVIFFTRLLLVRHPGFKLIRGKVSALMSWVLGFMNVMEAAKERS